MNIEFKHLKGDRWQIECYPHPALIEIFALSKRLKYKKGKVAEKKAGQIKLTELLLKLGDSRILQLDINDQAEEICNASTITALKGQALKSKRMP